MGIAASQARYLSLLARQSDCEYEGQQIQQSILDLANKSSKLFNQMLDINPPSPPSKTDFTTIAYTYTDEETGYKYNITSWQRITGDPEGYNYIVTYNSDAPEEKGVQSFTNNPQVQFKSGDGSSLTYAERSARLKAARDSIDTARSEYNKALNDYNALVSSAKVLSNYADTTTGVNISSITPSEEVPPNTYTVNQQVYNDDGYAEYTVTETGDPRFFKDGVYYVQSGAGTEEDPYVYTVAQDEEGTEYTPITEAHVFTNYNSLSDKSVIDTAVSNLTDNGALESGYDKSKLYYNDEWGIAFVSDLSASPSTLPLYTPDKITEITTDLSTAKANTETKAAAIEIAANTYYTQDVPSYTGNTELINLQSLSDSTDAAAITQIMKDMQASGVKTNLVNCFKPGSTVYDASTYDRGIYKYEKNNSTTYLAFDDLVNSYLSAESENQVRLPNYASVLKPSTQSKSSKAYIETDSSGRFTSIRFPDDANVHVLTVEETSDEAAYEDAMQQYNYDMVMYDKAVADINAKTSIINAQDKTLELKLSQLDIERTALKTELEAVQKVLKDNVERSFKTFNN